MYISPVLFWFMVIALTVSALDTIKRFSDSYRKTGRVFPNWK